MMSGYHWRFSFQLRELITNTGKRSLCFLTLGMWQVSYNSFTPGTLIIPLILLECFSLFLMSRTLSKRGPFQFGHFPFAAWELKLAIKYMYSTGGRGTQARKLVVLKFHQLLQCVVPSKWEKFPLNFSIEHDVEILFSCATRWYPFKLHVSDHKTELWDNEAFVSLHLEWASF